MVPTGSERSSYFNPIMDGVSQKFPNTPLYPSNYENESIMGYSNSTKGEGNLKTNNDLTF